MGTESSLTLNQIKNIQGSPCTSVTIMEQVNAFELLMCYGYLNKWVNIVLFINKLPPV